jgi:hypothetical protein
MTDLVIRALAPGEEHLFESLPDPGLVGFAAFGDTYSGMAAEGQYRREWTWVAIRGDTVVARAAWWAGPEDDKPLVLDWFDFTDADAGVTLLRTAPLQADLVSGRFPAEFRSQLRTQLDELGVELLLGTSLRELPKSDPGRTAPFTVTTRSGVDITADIWFPCYGAVLNNDYLDADLSTARHPNGQLAVTRNCGSTLRRPSSPSATSPRRPK